MKLRDAATMLSVLCVSLLLLLAVESSVAWAGLMRITMKDNTSVEVPYFWEENGEIKFEMAGGVAGIPKAQVTSIQEVLAAKEFDPEVLLEAPKSGVDAEQQKAIRDLIASKTPVDESYQRLSPEESSRLLSLVEGSRKGATPENAHVRAPLFAIEADFAEMVRSDGGDVMLLIRNVLSSRTNMHNYAFSLTLYDTDGNVMQKKPCELRELDLDRKTLRKVGIAGSLYSVTTTIKPDAKIKRYEITAAQR